MTTPNVSRIVGLDFVKTPGVQALYVDVQTVNTDANILGRNDPVTFTTLNPNGYNVVTLTTSGQGGGAHEIDGIVSVPNVASFEYTDKDRRRLASTNTTVNILLVNPKSHQFAIFNSNTTSFVANLANRYCSLVVNTADSITSFSKSTVDVGLNSSNTVGQIYILGLNPEYGYNNTTGLNENLLVQVSNT